MPVFASQSHGPRLPHPYTGGGGDTYTDVDRGRGDGDGGAGVGYGGHAERGGGHRDRGGRDEYGFDIYGTPSEKRHFQNVGSVSPGALAARYMLSQ